MAEDNVTPDRCVIGVGIPTSKAAFEAAIARGGRRFADQFLGGWVQYREQWIFRWWKFTAGIAPLGVEIVTDLTLARFKSMLLKGRDVVVLLSHWDGDRVEFADGFAGYSQVAQTIPPQFTGILDLGVCHPDALVCEILRTRPGCLARYIPERVKPDLLLLFYQALFVLLKEGTRTYAEALKELTLGLVGQDERRVK